MYINKIDQIIDKIIEATIRVLNDYQDKQCPISQAINKQVSTMIKS